MARAAQKARRIWSHCLEGGVLVGALYGAVFGVLIGLGCMEAGLFLPLLLLIGALSGAVLGMLAGALCGMFAGIVSGSIVIGNELLGRRAEPSDAGAETQMATEMSPARAPAGRGDEAAPT
jgi:hypothetical protein